MKLANALSQRAELQTRIRQLEGAIEQQCAGPGGEDPAEDPMELLRELDEDYAQLEALIARINRTNSVTLVDGVPLSDLLARRDCMTGRLGILPRIFKQRQQPGQPPDSGRDPDPQHRQRPGAAKQVDQQAKSLRELDAAIQETNWTTELMEH